MGVRLCGLLGEQLSRDAAGLVDPGDGDGGDPGAAADGAGIACIVGGDGGEAVLVDEFDRKRVIGTMGDSGAAT